MSKFFDSQNNYIEKNQRTNSFSGQSDESIGENLLISNNFEYFNDAIDNFPLIRPNEENLNDIPTKSSHQTQKDLNDSYNNQNMPEQSLLGKKRKGSDTENMDIGDNNNSNNNKNPKNKGLIQMLKPTLADQMKDKKQKTKIKNLNDESLLKRMDNKNTKIKTYVANSHLKFLNKLLDKRNEQVNDKIENLCMLDPSKLKEKNKIEVNIELWNTPFKNIYLNTTISKKEKKPDDYNKNIINKIYDYKEKDKDIKEIRKYLDLTFGEVFRIFTREKAPIPEKDELTKKIKNSTIIEHGNFEGLKDFYDYLEKYYTKKGKDKIFIKKYIEDKDNGIEVCCLQFYERFKEKLKKNIKIYA